MSVPPRHHFVRSGPFGPPFKRRDEVQHEPIQVVYVHHFLPAQAQFQEGRKKRWYKTFLNFMQHLAAAVQFAVQIFP